MSEAEDLASAIEELRLRAVRYHQSRSFYDGMHPTAYSTPRWESEFGRHVRGLRDNLCPLVVDNMIDRIQAKGWMPLPGSTTTDADAELATKIWSRERMDVRAPETYRESATTGDGYAMVWADPKTGVARIYTQNAEQCTVRYSQDNPGTYLWSCKTWVGDDKRNHSEIYYPDHIARFDGSEASELPISDGSYQQVSEAPNPFGFVPMGHFANNARVGYFGRAEYEVAEPLQVLLNKSVASMAMAEEVLAYPLRYLLGLDIQYDENGDPINPLNASMHNMLLISGNKSDVEAGQFPASDPMGFIHTQEAYRNEIGHMTRTPSHMLSQTSGTPSGEALRTAEASFVAKVRSRTNVWGDVWEDLMAKAVVIETYAATGAIRPLPEFELTFRDPESVSELERAQLTTTWVAAGIPLRETLVRTQGYTPEEAQEVADEAKAEAAVVAKAAMDAAAAAPKPPSNEVE